MTVKQSFQLLTAMTLISVSVVLMLFLFKKPQPKNGFKRNFIPAPLITPRDTVDLRYDSYYIAGYTNHHLYLGNLVAPRHLVAVDVVKAEAQQLVLSLPDSDSLKYWNIIVKVDSPDIYLADGAVPMVYRGILTSPALSSLENRSPYFLDYTPMGSHHFAIRSVAADQTAVLGQWSLHNLSVNYFPTLLEKQIDGIFCTEGTMHYNAETKRLLYLYAYRNQFLVLDTSFHLLARHHTIDTISTAQLNVARVSSNRSITLASPPTMVNYHSAVWQNFLLVHSALLADNEDPEQFGNASPIDVYDVDQGRYGFSFYIPHSGKKSLRNFRIVGDVLVALYERHLVIYEMPAALRQYRLTRA